MRVLLDTNVLVRANKRARGPARELLSRLCQAPHAIIISPFILTELVRVLSYPRVQAQYQLSLEEIRAFTDEIQQLAEVVSDLPSNPNVLLGNDPDDNPILRVAAAAHVDVLCTLDRHFQHVDVQSFCRQSGIRVMTDVELLQWLRTLEQPYPT